MSTGSMNVIVKASDYGLDEVRAKEVESVFLPVVSEMQQLEARYSAVMAKEMSPEVAKESGEVRWALVKLRKSQERIHKVAKAFYLAGGRFADAWKNKNEVVIESMEDTLSPRENYYEILEAERLDKLRADRHAELLLYTESPVFGVEAMEDNIYANYLAGIKLNYEIRIAYEAKVEAERLAKETAIELHRTRKESILKLWSFVDPEIEYLNFGTMGDEKWSETKLILSTRKEKRDAEILAAKVENERLQRETEIQALELARAEEVKAKALAEQKAIADTEAKRISDAKAATDAENARVAKIALDLERTERLKEEAERQRLEKIVADAKIVSDRLEADRLAEMVRVETDKMTALKQPDKVKLVAWIVKLQIEMPEMKNESARATAKEIADKFEGFRKWANQQIEKL